MAEYKEAAVKLRLDLLSSRYLNSHSADLTGKIWWIVQNLSLQVDCGIGIFQQYHVRAHWIARKLRCLIIL